MSGEINTGDELYNPITGHTERLNQLFIMDGKNRNAINKLVAGDIGATLKLKDTLTNPRSAQRAGFQFDPIHFPAPRLQTAIVAKNKADDEKLGTVLQEIHQEDPTLEVDYNRELKQVLLGSQGELHLAVTKWRLEKVYHLAVEFEKPRIRTARPS